MAGTIRTSIALAVSALAVLLSTNPASAADPFGAPIPLTTDETRAANPAVIGGSDSIRTVAWLEPRDGTSIGPIAYAQVDQSGNVIAGGRIPSAAVAGPLLAWMPDGRVMAVWTERDALGYRVIEPGATLGAGGTVETSPDPHGGLDVTSLMTRLGDGRVLAGWIAGRDGRKARVEIAVLDGDGDATAARKVSKGKLGPGAPAVSSDTDMETGHVLWTDRRKKTVLGRSVSLGGAVGGIRKPFKGLKGREYLGDAGNRIIVATRETRKGSKIEIARFDGHGRNSELGKRDSIKLARNKKISHTKVLPRMQSTLGFPVATWAGFKGIASTFVGTGSGTGCTAVMRGSGMGRRPEIGWIDPQRSALLWKARDGSLTAGVSGRGCGRGGKTMTLDTRKVDDYAITGLPRPLAAWTLENRDGVYMALG